MSFLNDLNQVNHHIPLSRAIEFTTRFQRELPHILQQHFTGALPFSETFNRSVFDSLLATPETVAIRAYLGLDEDRQIRLIFVSVNDQNQDILPSHPDGAGVYEFGQRCPPICGTNPINPTV